MEKKALNSCETVERVYNHHARTLPEITVVAIQNHETKSWDVYGTVTEIGPHMHEILCDNYERSVGNHKFLQRCIAMSISLACNEHQQLPDTAQPRPSSHGHHKLQCLIEDMNTFSFQV